MCTRICNLALLTLLLTIVTISTVRAKERPCPIAFKCSNDEDVAWATDEQKCYVFRNNCQLKNENCQRQNNYQEVLKEVSKDECQEKCSDVCTEEYAPVCAEYNDVKREFSNDCVLTNHICNSGETYILFGRGPC